MCREITVESPEFKRMLNEVLDSAAAERRREELSEKSFRIWVCEVVERIAERLGFYITGLSEFIVDLGYSLKKGFQAGREEARRRSYRYQDQKKEQEG